LSHVKGLYHNIFYVLCKKLRGGELIYSQELRLNLSFLSSDILTYSLKNNMNKQASYYSTEQNRRN